METLPEQKVPTTKGGNVRRRRLAGAVAVGAAISLVALAGASSAQQSTRTPSPAGAASGAAQQPGDYEAEFIALYDRIKDPANGYFSENGIPYHSVETLIVEAPDYGHVTTSEAFSYWLWLEASYGRVTEDWQPFNDAWQTMEDSIIPSSEQQPTNSFYDASAPATFIPEQDEPSGYPSPITPEASSGTDPLSEELSSTYGTDDIYGMHWLLDVDNAYGYGECGDGTTAPSYINTFQRGSQESVWETVPHPSCDTFDFGGENGFLDLFVGDEQYAQQWRYTNAPDADARAVQAAYWALTWAEEQGQADAVADSVAKAAQMGDYLRYSFFDKYFKQIGECVGAAECPGGSGKDSAHYLLSWYYAWGGATNADAGWAWRIGGSSAHFGYQNPMAAWALSSVPELAPQSPSAVEDWEQSLQRQLEFYTWLQSSEGAIAGGATNSWAGRYDEPPADAANSTFYGMYYDWQPVYHDPPSNQWFGMQAWSMERIAELYYETGNEQAGALLDKWVPWVLSETTVGQGGEYAIPDTLAWNGAPDTWNPDNPSDNADLHVTVESTTQDVGVTGALAKALMYYAAASDHTEARTTAKGLLDALLANGDDLGIAVPETREDFDRFDDPVYVPEGWTGQMGNGEEISSDSTFLSLRSFYNDDPNIDKVQEYLEGGEAPTFTYHRFWAQADIAIALAEYARLFPGE